MLMLMLMFPSSLFPQGLFENAISSSENKGVAINGFIRSEWYGSKVNDNPWSTSTLYAQPALQLTASGNGIVRGYADIRFRTGWLYHEADLQLDIREAYLDLNGKWSRLRIGKQIMTSGRADGMNPTDQLNPKNYFYRSFELDDWRIGTFAVHGQIQPVGFLRFESSYRPIYTPSNYRFDLIGLPEYVHFAPLQAPGFSLADGMWSIKSEIILSSLELSLSWQRGYDTLPSLNPGAMPVPPFETFQMELIPSVFQTDLIGGDIALFLGKTGLRGEWAWKDPLDKKENPPILPHPELSYTVSLDRSFGSFHLILAYTGKWVKDFEPVEPPASFDPASLTNPNIWPHLEGMLMGYLDYTNRILFDQTDEWIHSLIFRPSGTLFHEMVEWEMNSLYNFTTEEYLIWPAIFWKATDGCRIGAGYQYYYGPENTRFHWISDLFNGPQLSLRLTF